MEIPLASLGLKPEAGQHVDVVASRCDIDKRGGPPLETPCPETDVLALVFESLTEINPERLIPDLLHPTPRTRVDLERTRLAVSLAFASGVAGGLFADALDRASVTPSTWQPSLFASNLFVQQFVTLCFRREAVSTTQLVNLLTRPPSSLETIEHRRAIAGELAQKPDLRAAAVKLHTTINRFRLLLEGATGVGKWDATRHQLDGADTAGAEGRDRPARERLRLGLVRLARLARVGDGIGAKANPTARSPTSCDTRSASPRSGLKVSVGADGRIHGFEVMSIQENSENPFVNSGSSPGGSRSWSSSCAATTSATRRSWRASSTRCSKGCSRRSSSSCSCSVTSSSTSARSPSATAPSRTGSRCPFHVRRPSAAEDAVGLFNPLLLAHDVEARPVRHPDRPARRHRARDGPELGRQDAPAPERRARAAARARRPLHPREAGTVALAPALVVSLIQETKADQAEGRLGMGLVRIRALFEQLPPGAMVILDELCSGTNPSEGEKSRARDPHADALAPADVHHHALPRVRRAPQESRRRKSTSCAFSRSVSRSQPASPRTSSRPESRRGVAARGPRRGAPRRQRASSSSRSSSATSPPSRS